MAFFLGGDKAIFEHFYYVFRELFVMFSLKHVVSLLASIALASCCFVACDDDNNSDNGGNDKDKGNKITKHVTEDQTIECTELTEKTDYSKSGDDMMEYLINHCRLSTYFQSEAFTGSDQKLGSPCFCYGDKCSMANYERPEQGKIYGCDGVKGIPEYGMVPICLRSSRLELVEPAIYFPNGMCALAVSSCETKYDPACSNKGSANCDGIPTPEEDAVNGVRPYICSFAKFGNPEAITNDVNFTSAETQEKIKGITCPDGNVLVQFMMDIKMKANETQPTESLLDLVACFKGCHSDSDCRTGEYDYILQEPGQLKCSKTDPNDEGQSAGVCFDLRSVEFSNISEHGIKAINVGDYLWQD